MPEEVVKICKVHGEINGNNIYIKKYYDKRRSKLGYSKVCKICMNDRNRKYYHRINKEEKDIRMKNGTFRKHGKRIDPKSKRFCLKHGELKIGEFVVYNKVYKNGGIHLQRVCRICMRERAIIRWKKILTDKDIRGKYINYRRSYTKREVKNLSYSYVIRIIKRNSNLKSEDIPEVLIDLKRIHLQLKRELKNVHNKCLRT